MKIKIILNGAKEINIPRLEQALLNYLRNEGNVTTQVEKIELISPTHDVL